MIEGGQFGGIVLLAVIVGMLVLLAASSGRKTSRLSLCLPRVAFDEPAPTLALRAFEPSDAPLGPLNFSEIATSTVPKESYAFDESCPRECDQHVSVSLPLTPIFHSVNRMVLQERSVTLSGIGLTPAIVCWGDVIVEDHTVVTGALKVRGNLSVGADVIFLNSVVVDGTMTTGERCVFMFEVMVKRSVAIGRDCVFRLADPRSVATDQIVGGFNRDHGAEPASLKWLKAWTVLCVTLLVQLAGILGSNEVFSLFAEDFNLADCHFGILVRCVLRRESHAQLLPLFALSSVAIGIILIATSRFKTAPVAPVLALMGAVLGACASFDIIASLPVRNLSDIFSSTYNVTSIIVALSTVMAVATLQLNQRLLPAIMIATFVSFAARSLFMMGYLFVEPAYQGATSLFLLFTSFSLGVFPIHIAAISRLLAWTPRVDLR